jgi:hypothetical protein
MLPVRRALKVLWRVVSVALTVAFVASSSASCGGEVVLAGSSAQTQPPETPTPPAPRLPLMQSLWPRSVGRVVIEVDYGPGAAPYVGAVPGVGNTWNILAANARRLFQGSGKSLVIPSTLGEMQRIEVTGRDFTLEDLVAITRRTRNNVSTAATATFHVIFLDGYYVDAAGVRRTDLLGGHLDGMGVIVVFKPVVASTAANAAAWVPAVVEQATLVHELGHAVGLVDGGIAPVRGHHDVAHPHHCTSNMCVMNAWNEGASAASAFVARVTATGNSVLFDDACLEDAAAAIAAAR